jgi:uncharacterized caspase-like protein
MSVVAVIAHPNAPRRRHLLALGLLSATMPALAQLRVGRTGVRSGGSRVALVIGNADYAVRPLRNAVTDARSVATTLRELGYELVTRENATLPMMIDAMKSFWLKSRDADVRVVYFSGHGMQYHGRNYLVPVDAAIDREADVPRKAAALDEMIDKVTEAGRGVNIVILDACRTPPVNLPKTRSLGGTGPFAPGLAQVIAPQGTVVAFSTAPGAVAYDGSDGASPYTRNLIAQLRVPGQPIEQMFKRVRAAVARETADRQVPWETSSLTGDFCFRQGPSGRCPGA